MVRARKAIETLYDDTMTVSVRKEVIRDDHSTGFQEEDIIVDEPCRISFSHIAVSNADSSEAHAIEQQVKLFTHPEIDIPPGSRITVDHDGVTDVFFKSGESALYPTHQEIMLDIWKDWA